MTIAQLIAAAEALPLAALFELAGELGKLITRKSTEQSEVRAARTAASIAVDAFEEQETPPTAKR